MAEDGDVKTIETKTLKFHVREPKGVKAEKTFFFFSLSAHDSLFLPPFCHPVDSLIKKGARVISVTLPHHENNQRPYGIHKIWQKDKVRLAQFFDDLKDGVDELTKHFCPPFGALGISRGAFTSLHLASLTPHVTTVVGFAPMLTLNEDEDLNTFSQVANLKNKNIHFFVGNDDTLIGTHNVIKLQNKILEENKGANIHTKISPSIGRGGHGTSDPIFQEGALWAINNLKNK